MLGQAESVISDWFRHVQELASEGYDLELSPIAVETITDTDTARAAVGRAVFRNDAHWYQ
jgi:methionine synthase I (cobalamin-dependent)